MRIKIVLVLALLLPVCVYAGKPLISKHEFTLEFNRYLEEKVKDSEFSVMGDLHLHASGMEGYELNIYLDNAYEVYLSGVRDIDLIFNDQLESIKNQKKTLSNSDVKSILPVIKPYAYIESSIVQLKEAGYDKDDIPLFYEKLNEDLYLMYVFDSAESMRFVSPKEVEKHGIKDSIRDIASKNIESYYSKIEAQLREIDTKGNGRAYLFFADENYEASILMGVDYLKRLKLEIDGDPVVFIPARNVVLIVGSNDSKAIDMASSIAARGYRELGYAISPFGYKYLDGKWSRF